MEEPVYDNYWPLQHGLDGFYFLTVIAGLFILTFYNGIFHVLKMALTYTRVVVYIHQNLLNVTRRFIGNMEREENLQREIKQHFIQIIFVLKKQSSDS